MRRGGKQALTRLTTVGESERNRNLWLQLTDLPGSTAAQSHRGSWKEETMAKKKAAKKTAKKAAKKATKKKAAKKR